MLAESFNTYMIKILAESVGGSNNDNDNDNEESNDNSKNHLNKIIRKKAERRSENEENKYKVYKDARRDS